MVSGIHVHCRFKLITMVSMSRSSMRLCQAARPGAKRSRPLEKAFVFRPSPVRSRLSSPSASYRVAMIQSSSVSYDSMTNLGNELRGQFPILNQLVHDKQLVYLDNAATSQKPQVVIDAMNDYYSQYNSNVHRGVHALSARATTQYEQARQRVADFVNASSAENIVFTRNATEAINLVANTWAASALERGDEVILSVAEHHSNIVPWQILAEKKGIVLKFVRLDENQEIDMNHLEELATGRTRLISLVHISNALGCRLPVDTVIQIAKKSGARVLLDACQSVANIPIDVQKLGVDWIVGSAHKMCGPTGIGFLWGTTEALESMPPWMGGGEMIDVVTLEKTTFASPPSRFEAGTPAIAEAIGFGQACDFMLQIGMENVEAYEKILGARLHTALENIDDGITVYGPPHDRVRGALATFNVEGIHPTDLSTILDQSGIAVRSGHLCTQPLHAALGISSSIRASPYLYNTVEEVDAFAAALGETISFFR
jgi:cysteine desulfurase/selenocysteine lyase